MSVLMIATPTEKTLDEQLDWLDANGIPANDALPPVFVDTDTDLVHWDLVVHRAEDPGTIRNGLPWHGCILVEQLDAHGLAAQAVELGAGGPESTDRRLALKRCTPLLTPPPASIVAGGDF